MANNHDIRVWAESEGIEVSRSGPLSADVKQKYQAYLDGRDTDADDPMEAMRAEVAEQAPVIKKETVSERVRRRLDDTAKVSKGRPARGRPAKAAKPRVSIERMLTRGWSLLGDLAGNFLPATGRMMEVQAPVAGMLLEQTMKESVVDRVLQPVARAEQAAGIVAMLMGPVVCTALIEIRPDQAPKLIKELRRQMMTWVEIAGPKLEEIVQREKVAEEKYGADVDALMEDVLSRVLIPEDTPA